MYQVVYKNKVDYLDLDRLKTASIDFKKLIDIIDKNVLKKLKYKADKRGLD